MTNDTFLKRGEGERERSDKTAMLKKENKEGTSSKISIEYIENARELKCEKIWNNIKITKIMTEL